MLFILSCVWLVDGEKKLNVKTVMKKIAPGLCRENNCVAEAVSVTRPIELLAACQ